MGIADWAEVLFTGGLWDGSEEWVGAMPVPTLVCTNVLKRHGPMCLSPTHQGGSSCLGRRSSQMCQHLFHLGELLSTDVVCVWVSGRRSVPLEYTQAGDLLFLSILSSGDPETLS